MALGKIIREFGVKLSLAYDKGGFEQANSAVDKMSSTLKEIGSVPPQRPPPFLVLQRPPPATPKTSSCIPKRWVSAPSASRSLPTGPRLPPT